MIQRPSQLSAWPLARAQCLPFVPVSHIARTRAFVLTLLVAHVAIFTLAPPFAYGLPVARALGAGVQSAGVPVEILALNEVVPGLTGTGYTVVQGDKIEPFDVEILGVLENAAASGSLVMVRVGGELIERTGGIAAGMSGSPVYVDGRLLGAISYGFPYADQRIGLVTPAEDMMEVLNLALARRLAEGTGNEAAGAGALAETEDGAAEHVSGNGAAGAQHESGGPRALGGTAEVTALGDAAPAEGRPIRWVAVAADLAGAADLRHLVGDDVWVASPVASPLVVSGFGARALGRVRSLAEKLDLIPVMGGVSGGTVSSSSGAQGGAQDGAHGGTGDLPVLPGSSLGVQLMRGDANLTVLGTVTHVQDGGVVAFGHPIMNRGSVSFFAVRAEVLTTVRGLMYPFKVGNPAALVGAAVEDRSAGVGGLLGVEPESVALSVEVEDADRGKITRFSARAAKDPVFTVPILSIGALEAIDRGIDRIGEGTAHVRVVIEGEGMPKPLVRSNMFYSEIDIAAQGLAEAQEALGLLVNNEFADPGLRSVEIEVRIERGRATARVVEATPRASKVTAGEEVPVDVTLRPFREEPFTVTVPLRIPAWAASGEVMVTVRGGGFGLDGALAVGTEGSLFSGDYGSVEMAGSDFAEAESLKDLIEKLESRPKNNDLVIEFYPPYDWDEDRSGDEGLREDEPGWERSGQEEGVGGDRSDPKSDGLEGAGSESFGPAGAPGDEPVRVVRSLGYVIEGEVFFTLEIESAHGSPLPSRDLETVADFRRPRPGRNEPGTS